MDEIRIFDEDSDPGENDAAPNEPTAVDETVDDSANVDEAEATEDEAVFDGPANDEDERFDEDALAEDDSVDSVDSEPDDLEEAYRRALEALECAEEQADETLADHPVEEPAEESDDDFDISASDEDGERRISPRKVIEAVMFVGGESVTTRKLCSVIRGEFTPEQVTKQIEIINEQYTRENRPYEIVLHEGGYSLKLRHKFHAIQRRVFGMGPREIKLSQDVLEVLALVAYRQPITREEIDECGRSNVSGLLRQLVRRQLIAVDRSAGRGKDVVYTTTQRFLDVFGIGDPKELPRPETIEFK